MANYDVIWTSGKIAQFNIRFLIAKFLLPYSWPTFLKISFIESVVEYNKNDD